MQTLLDDIQKWYTAQCDGDWEHCFGIKIETLDNPGWSIRIDLKDTLLENKIFTSVEKHASEESWIVCKVEEKRFIAYGGPDCLQEMLGIFLQWAKSETDWLAVPTETEFAERREREFQMALGDEIGPEECAAPTCDRKRIQHSIFCRDHHTEMVRKQSNTQNE